MSEEDESIESEGAAEGGTTVDDEITLQRFLASMSLSLEEGQEPIICSKCWANHEQVIGAFKGLHKVIYIYIYV